MALTREQQLVVDTIVRPDVSLLKVKACAGAGKTHTLIEIAKTINPAKGMYIAYNKAIQLEAEEKFHGTPIQCLTVHSLAYRSTVKQYGLKPGWFNPRDVKTDGMQYRDKKTVVTTIEDFLSSEYTDVNAYLDEHNVDTYIGASITEHLDLMADGEMDCPHSFYLKMFQILLKLGHIPAIEADLVLIDEFGDVNAVILDIFMMIKSPKKVAVGDSMQNIYSFNNTVNGFEQLDDQGVTVELTQSFRVSDVMATRIQGFIKQHLSTTFEFKGREYPTDYPIRTKAYIARTNSGLLEEMLRLQMDGVQFSTTRKIETILELPLVLANLGNGQRITNTRFKVIEKLRAEWEEGSKLPAFAATHKSPLRYVLAKLKGDDEISYGADIVMKHGPYEINALVKYVNDCNKVDTSLTLTTAHSSKGLEFDHVEIAPDFNARMDDSLEALMMARIENNEDQINIAEEEFRLYYVACSRALVRLTNADHLPRPMIKG